MSNLATLTRSHKIIAEKRRAKRQQIQHILFDDAARCEFLTGFHKRKLAKADAARKKAQERDKQARLEARREQRRALREQAIENARTVEGAYASIYGHGCNDEDEWSGIDSPPADKGNQRAKEYEDEQVLATVTVVEDFDPDTILHDPPKSHPPSANLPYHHPSKPSTKSPSKTTTTTTPSGAVPKKSKPRQIRYQTKEARKADRLKQFARRAEKAERAGGKPTRKKYSKKKKSG